MYIRRDYLYTRCSFDEYYSQFVTSEVLSYVDSKLGNDIILSKDETFKDIELSKWDKLVYNLKPLISDQLLIEAQEGWSLMTGVCIVKVTAKLIWRNHNESQCW
jgi:hypothetical protein